MSSQPTTSRPHVVIIDDEEDLCELLILRLEHHGYRATAEQTIRGGLEILEREQVDALIVDLRLENENGLDLLSQVVNRTADLPVIILTAHGTIETAVDAMKRGAYGFLTKPFDNSELLQKLQQAVERGRLQRELAGLRRLVGSRSTEQRLLGTSEALVRVREVIARAAPTDASVLIFGESGTGKEVAARSIHEASSRKAAPFVAVECAALPFELLESELFGSVPDASAGATSSGLLGSAASGTLFLDEVGDAPAGVQARLLRALQERDVRIVASTSRDLRADVAEGRFREDLFYRLHVVPLRMPPLRERPEDIPLLAEIFLSRATAKHGLDSFQLTGDALRILLTYPWPGNVRELTNVVEGAAVLSVDGRLRAEHVLSVLPQPTPSSRRLSEPSAAALVHDPLPDFRPLVQTSDGDLLLLRQAREAFDRLYLEEALIRSGGNVSAAARLAGRNRTDFHELLRRHEINSADFREGGKRWKPNAGSGTLDKE